MPKASPLSTLYAQPHRHGYLQRPIWDEHHKLIVACLLDRFSLGHGQTIVEVGSGQGRYTELLLDRGLQVLALEPDAHMAQRLRERFADENRVRIIQSFPYEPSAFPADVSAVCGFHVLHHMDADALQRLSAVLHEMIVRRPHFRGWFFLDPNPLNILYPLQIAARSAMRFREEKGIWLNRYGRSLASAEPATLGYIGYFPPGRLTQRLPTSLQKTGTRLTCMPSPLRAYKVLGHLARGTRATEGATAVETT
jgi:SAM-dependent methyltransferase